MSSESAPGAGADIAGELLELVAEVVGSSATAMPGARAVVDVTAAAVPIAVASNSPRALLEAALVRGGFTGTFPVSIAADDIPADLVVTRCGTVICWPG
jgi:beta-phosphoglucomutase-like phosphatase (HAD superfamily)